MSQQESESRYEAYTPLRSIHGGEGKVTPPLRLVGGTHMATPSLDQRLGEPYLRGLRGGGWVGLGGGGVYG